MTGRCPFRGCGAVLNPDISYSIGSHEVCGDCYERVEAFATPEPGVLEIIEDGEQ